MIKDKTVLVLGAGASAPYGLPLGRELTGEIIEGIGSNRLLFKHVRDNYPTLWRTFIDRLVYSDCDSIDAFLEKGENQDLMGIGKDSIAAGILPKETVGNLFQYHREEPSWYSQLRSLLFEEVSFDDMAKKNNLNIITFNYDRSLEYYLTRAISETFQKSMEESAKKLQETVKIIHVHGKFGPLPHEISDQQQSMPYEILSSRKGTPDERLGWIRFAASKIKIIHEATDDTPDFVEAHKYLMDAKKIFFFGFGFHPTNCRRLKLENFSNSNIEVYCTCKGLPADRIKRLLNFTKGESVKYPLFELNDKILAKIAGKNISEFIDTVGIL